LMAFALSAAVCTDAAVANVRHKKLRLHRRPEDGSLVTPFRFDQRLLVCNAYPNSTLSSVEKNEKEVLSSSEHGIAYRGCRYINGEVKTGDKLDLILKDSEIRGAFEVGDLPASDAVLLLVLERHSGSSMVNFQSFAFPTGRDSKEAQLAVIDAYKSEGNTTFPRLRMEDHITGKEKQTISRRIEHLNFNRVYAIEEGTYDASVSEHSANETHSSSSKVVKFAKNQNYVILRTGDEEFGQKQSLVVFPDVEVRNAGRSAFVHMSIFAFVLGHILAGAW